MWFKAPLLLLDKSATLGQCSAMGASAAELFEQVKHLPAEEKETFVKLFQQWEEKGHENTESPPQPTAGPVQIPDYAARLTALFPDGGLTGDPQEFWDYVRAERF
jgi:hypothetical protein